MRHCPSRSISNHLPGHALLIAGSACLAIAFLAIKSPADAGIGNPLKKLKEKAAKAAGEKTEPEASEVPAGKGKVEYDDLVIELTSDRVQRILAAFKGTREAGVGRPELVEKLSKANDERYAFSEKHWKAIEALRNKRSDVEVCYQEGYEEAKTRRLEEYKEKALTDPTIREKFARAAQENNAAAEQGDSAATGRIMQTFWEVAGTTHEDSLKVRQKCGPIPPHSADEDRLDALDKNIAALQEKIRQLDEKVAKTQAKEGGLNEGQWSVALERIRNYMAWRGSKPDMKSLGQFFSPAEIEALEKYLEELRAALG